MIEGCLTVHQRWPPVLACRREPQDLPLARSIRCQFKTAKLSLAKNSNDFIVNQRNGVLTGGNGAGKIIWLSLSPWSVAD